MLVMPRRVLLAVWVAILSAGLQVACGASGPGAVPSTDAGDAAAVDGAGGAASDGGYDLCDGTSKLRLAFQVSGGGQVLLGVPVLAQNGFVYLFVDGSCRYWVFGNANVGELGFWLATHTGVLTANEVADLTADLDVKSWSDRNEFAGACDGSNVTLWRPGAVMTLSQKCGATPPPGVIGDLAKKATDSVIRLWDQGAPVDTPIRFQAIVGMPPELDDPKRPTTTLNVALAPVALPYQQASTTLDFNTPGVLLTDETAVGEMRKRRDQVIAGDFLLHGGDMRVLPVLQDGTRYFVYFRDTIPFEDADGLIRPPPLTK
jgi:hypothetical protein